MPYCGRDHQGAHREAHKRTCAHVRKTYKQLMDEDKKLRDFVGDGLHPPRPFETSVGRFGDICATRPYMEARYAYVQALLLVDTEDAVKRALDESLDMLRLGRTDGLGVRRWVPALLLRLDQDQKCFDFVEMWSISPRVDEEDDDYSLREYLDRASDDIPRHDSDYDDRDLEMTSPDVVSADAFEEPYFCNSFLDLNYLVSITLLKVRLLQDLKSLQHSNVLTDKVPQEIVDIIRRQLVGNMVAKRKDLMSRTDLSKDIQQLDEQVDRLMELVEAHTEDFWLALTEPDDFLEMQFNGLDDSSTEVFLLAIEFNYAAWQETPGALDIIRSKLGLDESQESKSA